MQKSTTDIAPYPKAAGANIEPPSLTTKLLHTILAMYLRLL